MGAFLDFLIDFVYPKKCVVCGKPEVFLCNRCLKELEYSEQICPECGEESIMGWTHEKCREKYGMDGLIAIYDYQDERVRKVVDEIKFGFNQMLAKEVIKKCSFELGVTFDGIVPIPLFYYRENWRGFNQAEILAKQISEQVGIPVEKLLMRSKRTKQQSMVMSIEERKKNVEGAFMVTREEGVKGKTVLLVDDVFTSGASMREACRTLRRAGAKKVWGFALAH